ncbi:uncharacterized protein KD926_011492 [Aspergillus affinis]|uniref:uncharacterized protein n=1 Tax=Aspergillus affinis TaxID=1070780 RepID=UPI0022FDEB5B|nr:uncharacterized protein KD926_011492 [Aspergillus affinis]KAI9037880.1 hypothetical protein KD926_011492 [Aspergillus affinis]
MSLPRASNPFRNPKKTRHYSRLACKISGSPIPRGSNRITTSTTSPTPGPASTSRTNTKRPFHTTNLLLRGAPRSPSVRRAEDVRSRLNPAFSGDGLYRGGVKNALDDIPARLEHLEKIGPKIWRLSIVEGFVDEKVDRKTFMRIAKLLLMNSAHMAPSADAIRLIDPNPNLVFEIGNVVGGNSPSLMQWIISSTAQAGAIIPTLMSAGRALALADGSSHTNLSSTQRSTIFQSIELLATSYHDPRAMILQAKYLGMQKRYDEAEDFLKSVMEIIYPSKTQQPPFRSMAVPFVDTPWAAYTWLKRRMGAPESEIQELLKTAAVEYQDPEALVTYARQMMHEQNDLPLYEEYMAKAATSGHATACRKLANFYYLTSRGRFPRRGTKSTDPEGDWARETQAARTRGSLATFLGGLFGPQPYHEYRGLAIEWYELAFRHGCPKAALALAILMRENGHDREQVEQVFRFAVGSKEMGGLVRGVRVNWEREDYVPVVPEEVLDV